MISLRAVPPFDCDVAIVGAGPAGASTAAHLSRAGLRVWLLDQKRFPRDKACGDLVGPVALAELAGLGSTSGRTTRRPTRSAARRSP